VTSTLGITHPRPVDLLPPTLQAIPEAVGKNIAIARARTRSGIMAVVCCAEPFCSGGYRSLCDCDGSVSVPIALDALTGDLRWRALVRLVRLARTGF
jgi:hypothetical protein